MGLYPGKEGLLFSFLAGWRHHPHRGGGWGKVPSRQLE